MLSDELIADTVIRLQQAGKRMPQEPAYGKDQFQEKMRILKETVDLWSGIFNEQHIGPERWQQAEKIALTMSSANGLNVNIISPALMQAALKLAEEAHVQETINRNNAEKKSADDLPLSNAINLMLLKWTRAKIKERRLIMPYMPDNRKVFEYGRKIGLSDNAIDRQFRLLQAYMSDWYYSRESGKPCASKLTRQGEELTLEVV